MRLTVALSMTSIKGWKTERDYWTGSHGASPFDFVWTGETVKKSGGEVSVNKEGV